MKKQLIDLLKEQDAKFESKSFNTEQISQLQEKLKNVIGSDWIQWPAFKKNFFIEYFAIAIVKLTKNKKFPKMAEQLEIDLWKIGRWIPYFYYVDLANEALEKDERYHNQDGSIDINKKISYLILLLIMADAKMLAEIIQIVYFPENWLLSKIVLKNFF
ncbi:hypothetical protein V6B68_03615 [Mesomycoplasma ovipneumoniae str. Black Butte]